MNVNAGAEVDDLAAIIAAWPPAAELTDAQFSVWIAHRHLDRLKHQFETDAAFDRAFVLAVARAAHAETAIAEGQIAARHDADRLMTVAAGVRLRRARDGMDQRGTLRDLTYWILVSAHQNGLGMLTSTRREANSRLKAASPAPVNSAPPE